MKLYRKKLDSVEALKQEKIRLRYQRRATKLSDLNPLGDLQAGTKSASAESGLAGMVTQLLSGKDNLQLMMSLVKPILSAAKGRNRRKEAYYEGRKPKKSLVGRLVKEVAVNYAIGKAVQMAVLGARILIKRQKAAKLRAQQQVVR